MISILAMNVLHDVVLEHTLATELQRDFIVI